MVTMRGVYKGNKKCEMTHEEGASLPTDAPKDIGGDASAFSPTDLVGAALATCILTTMGMWAERRNIDLTGTKVEVTKEMVKEPVRRIGALKVKVWVPKARVPDELRAPLERVGHSCPVHQSLHPDIDAPIEYIYE